MYLPADDMDARKRVTDAFLSYRNLCKAELWDRCAGVSHHSRVALCCEQICMLLGLYFRLVDMWRCACSYSLCRSGHIALCFFVTASVSR